jgi:CRISPR-associated protein Cas1
MYIQFKDRIPFISVSKGELSCHKGGLEVDGEQVPVSQISCIFIGPGTSVTHEAVKILSDSNCHIIFSGRNQRKLYAVDQSSFQDQDKISKQVQISLDDSLSLEAAKKLHKYRFGSEPDDCSSLPEIRGKEGSLMKEIYHSKSDKFGVDWNGRVTDGNWSDLDDINRAISKANSWLYGVVESAVVMAGFLPGIGILHRNRPRGLVFDLADVFKADTSISAAFSHVSSGVELEEGLLKKIEESELKVQTFGIMEDLFL